MEIEQPKRMTIEQLAGMAENGFAEMRGQFTGLEERLTDRIDGLDKRVVSVEKGLKGISYKVDQLDAKLDPHRQETKDGFAGLHRLVGGMSHTLADHEERIKALEGE